MKAQDHFSHFSIQRGFDCVRLVDYIDMALQLAVSLLPFSQSSFIADIQALLVRGLALYFHNQIYDWIATLYIENLVEYQIIDFPVLLASLGNDWRIHLQMSWNQTQSLLCLEQLCL